MHALHTLIRGRGRGALLAVVALAVLVPAIAISAPNDDADLRVTKSDSPDPILVGNVLTYTIQVRNLGPDPATNVTVSDTLPAGVNFVSASTGCTEQGRKITCAIGALAASGGGSQETVEIRVRPTSAGTIRNTARVQSREMDPQRANNDDTASTLVNARPGPPPPPPGPATCRGIRATLVGTPGPDRLLGTPRRDVVFARGGNDVIYAFGGRDLVCAGRGDDFVNAGGGDDVVFGGLGRDRLLGRAGADDLRGNKGADFLRGGSGPDRLDGGPGNDLCRGGPGVDLLLRCER